MTEIESLEKRIDELDDEVDRLDALSASANTQRQALQRQLAELKFGVKVGSIVIKDGVKHRVTHVKPSWCDKPWVRGNPMKKDGTYGTADRSLYTYWELVPA